MIGPAESAGEAPPGNEAEIRKGADLVFRAIAKLVCLSEGRLDAMESVFASPDGERLKISIKVTLEKGGK